jgi:hypothetical protein
MVWWQSDGSSKQEVSMHRPARRAAIIAAGAALAASGAIGVAAAAPSPHASAAATTLRYFAFDINNSTNDPGLVPVAGTNASAFAQGDELIINDQITVTHKSGNGYPIVGFDSGVCTLTRVPEKFAEQTLGNCVVTAVWKKGGSLTFQGVVHFKKQQPESAVLAVTGGTGRFDGARGVLDVGFTASHKVLTIKLK